MRWMADQKRQRKRVEPSSKEDSDADSAFARILHQVFTTRIDWKLPNFQTDSQLVYQKFFQIDGSCSNNQRLLHKV